MRISRKQVREALNSCSRTIEQAFKSNDQELNAWFGRIFPVFTEQCNQGQTKEIPTREEMIRSIVKDVLYRAFDNLT